MLVQHDCIAVTIYEGDEGVSPEMYTWLRQRASEYPTPNVDGSMFLLSQFFYDQFVKEFDIVDGKGSPIWRE